MHRLSQQHGKKCIMSVRVQPLGRNWLRNTSLHWASVLQGRFYGALLANISTIILFINCVVPHLMREDILRSDQSCGPCYLDASTPHARSCRLTTPLALKPLNSVFLRHSKRCLFSSAPLSLNRGDTIRPRTAAANQRTSFSSASRRERAGRAESSSGSGEENSSERARRAIMVLWRGLRRQVINTQYYITHIFFPCHFEGVELTFLFHEIRWQHAWMTLFCM